MEQDPITGQLKFNETEYTHVPELRPEMRETEARLALQAVNRRLEGLRGEVGTVEGDPRSRYQGYKHELQGLLIMLNLTRVQLEHILSPNLSLEALALRDPEFIQVELARDFQQPPGRV